MTGWRQKGRGREFRGGDVGVKRKCLQLFARYVQLLDLRLPRIAAAANCGAVGHTWQHRTAMAPTGLPVGGWDTEHAARWAGGWGGCGGTPCRQLGAGGGGAARAQAVQPRRTGVTNGMAAAAAAKTGSVVEQCPQAKNSRGDSRVRVHTAR